MRSNMRDIIIIWVQIFFFGAVFGIIAGDFDIGFLASFVMIIGSSIIRIFTGESTLNEVENKVDHLFDYIIDNTGIQNTKIPLREELDYRLGSMTVISCEGYYCDGGCALESVGMNVMVCTRLKSYMIKMKWEGVKKMNKDRIYRLTGDDDK